MNMINKVNSKSIAVLAASTILLLVTVQSKNKDAFYLSFHTSLTTQGDTIIPSKKKNIADEKNHKFLNDTLPKKIAASDTIPEKKIDSLSKPDSLQKKIDSLSRSDTSGLKKDTSGLLKTADTLHFTSSKNALDTVVEYSAEDSMVLDVPAKTVTLYGKKATTDYKDNNLVAPIITLDQATGDIIASIKRDSAGKVISLPTYTQGDFKSQSDSLRFNMKSGKGLTKSTYTQQGEMYVYGEAIKKIDNNVFFAKRGRFTTCDLDTPHFAFVSNKIKFITNKLAITGPVHPEFEGIPIPLYLPFGIFPLSQGRHSGFLSPNFTSNDQLGLGLEQLGYYKVISDYWDIIFRANVYSYGGWTFSVNPRYTKKYRYNGSLTFDIQNFKYNFKGDPDYSRNRSYHLSWNHSTDSKARPGVSFSASVNAGSSSYNSYVPDNPNRNFQNQMSSSIAYSKVWKDKPFNLTVTANHNQNTNLKIINVDLPEVGFNVNTIYPFRKKEFVGAPKWYENIGIAYNGNLHNHFSFYDTLPQIFKQIVDTFQFGAHHSFPISLSLPQIGAFQIGPSISYDETWYQKKTYHIWDPNRDTLLTKVQKGFYTAREMSFGLGISTRIFGLITAKNKNAKIQAIRHEITATLGISYKPDFNKNNFYTTQVDTSTRKQQFSVFEGNIFGPYSPGRFGGLTFGIDNNVSMKVRNKKDTGANAIKKISIIDGLSINGSYNFFADSLKFSPFQLSARSNLFDKINITGSAQLDPYAVNGQGRRINTFLWQRKPFTLGRLTNASLSMSTSYQGGNKKTGSDKAELKPGVTPQGYTNDEYSSEMNDIRNNPAEYADFNIPWSVNFNYSFIYSSFYDITRAGFKKNYSQNVNLGGTLALTPKWQMQLSGYYDITGGILSNVQLGISRDLHCWQMAISVSQGIYRSFSISISPKSPLLRDIKVNRTRSIRD
jgi:LPS-assembly protein